jgi:enoyl-CoA hydratase
MDYKQIRYEPGKVARIIINRPRYRNAQSRILLEEMDDAFNRAVADNDVRVIVLSGEGDHFSSGHDLGTPEEIADQKTRGYPTDGKGIYRYFREIYMENTLRWRKLSKPTIAMVQGCCVFGGWMIASSMDIIFASEDALFLPAHFQYFCAPWDVGPRKAKELIFENRYLTAQEARELQFVSRVFPREKLAEETLAFANRVAENDSFAIQSAKFSINHMMDTMGFTAEIEAAYQTYFINRYFNWSTYQGLDYKGKKLAKTDTALENVKLSKGQVRYYSGNNT